VQDTIPGLVAAAADRDPDRLWVRADGAELTFGQVGARVGAAAERLHEMGVRRGDLVVVTSRTTPPYLLTWLALATLGAVTVATNPAGTSGELSGLARQTGPRLIVTDPELMPMLARVGATGALGVVDVADVVAGEPSPTAYDVVLRSTVTPDDLAVLIPTSGTTGRSKLVMQTHRAYAWAGEGFPHWMGLRQDDVLMTSLPLFHINAQAYSTMGSLACGAGLVLLPRFSASGFLGSARHYGATEFNAIGAMLEILMRQPERDDDSDNPLRLCYTGPSPTRERQEATERRFGIEIVCGYAMSETPYGLIWPRGKRMFGTLGTVRQHPRLGTVSHARVVDDGGTEVSVGDTGELLLRNPVVTPGYWEMPEETALAITDGWLHTGDLVTVNADSSYTFVSRQKEVLRRRGENLSPQEVEDAVESHPSVLECAVIGVPSDLSEDEIKAFVVAVDGGRLDFSQLRDWAAERLTAFKVPRFWQQLESLPRTSTSRIAKHRLPDGHPDDEYDAEAAR
jgi:carnitine-CoA ligase